MSEEINEIQRITDILYGTNNQCILPEINLCKSVATRLFHYGFSVVKTSELQAERLKNEKLRGALEGLPVWTELHVQKLDISDESSKVFWFKHPHVKWTIYSKDFTEALIEFVTKWKALKETEVK